MPDPPPPHHGHRVNLWTCFVALLALTAAEVGLYEVWRHNPFVPKFGIVMLILIFTVPKAAIVLIFFMHLKFEKFTIVVLAVVPFIMVGVAVLPMLADSLALKPDATNKVEGLKDYSTLNTHDQAPTRPPGRQAPPLTRERRAQESDAKY